jgi:hypothetical protein
MAAHQSRLIYYGGFIELESQPRNWIKKHRSFASRDWLFGQVKFGLWESNDRKGANHFTIETKVLEGVKSLIVLIKLERLVDSVRVYHCHCRQV